MTDKKPLGYISVDAGIVLVGDPCYWLGDEEYDELLERYFAAGEKLPRALPVPPMAFFDHHEKREDKAKLRGAIIKSGHGDGVYPVFVEFAEDGVPARLVVEFVAQKEDSA
jgi:hypothetical protein